MTTTTIYSEYDCLARVVNEYWGPETSEVVYPKIEKLLLQNLPEKAQILDIGCGAGHLAKKLQNQGYQVTGIDGSGDLLRYARENSSNSQFIHEDARSFKSPSFFHGVVSTDYVLNHVLTIEELISVFRNVYESLMPNGLFMFDLRLDKLYRENWHNTMAGDVQENYAWAIKRQYNPDEKIGKIYITTFQLISNGAWQRSDNVWLIRGYLPIEITEALASVGFTDIKVYISETEDVATEESGDVNFICRK